MASSLWTENQSGMAGAVNHKTGPSAFRRRVGSVPSVLGILLGVLAPGAATATGRGGDAEIVLERRAVALERRAFPLIDHGAALQNDGAVGHAENLLGILLNHDGRGL